MTEQPKKKRDWVELAGDVGAVAIICMAVAIVGGLVYFLFKIFLH